MSSALEGTIILTGANGGLGSAIAARIASTPELRSYHTIYAVRNASSATALSSALKNASALHSYEIVSMDLSLLSSVRDTAHKINARVAASEVPPIRALILNAGYAEMAQQTFTEDGLDMTFVANYLGHWLLTIMLLQSMDRQTGRIVVLASWAHDPYDPQNKMSGQFADEKYRNIYFDNTDPIAMGTWSSPQEDPTWMSGHRRYGAAKLCEVMMIGELQRRLDLDPVLNNVSILGIDPGFMTTGIARRHESWFVRNVIHGLLMTVVVRLLSWIRPSGLFRTEKKSAGHILAAAFSSDAPFSQRPKALHLDGLQLKEPSAESKDPRKRMTLWEDSTRYARVEEGDTILADWR